MTVRDYATAFVVCLAAFLSAQDHSLKVSDVSQPSTALLPALRPSGFHQSDYKAATQTCGRRLCPNTTSLPGQHPYFEGWYVKVVSDEGQVVSFILGSFYGTAEAHAFIFVFDSTGHATRHDFDLSSFHAAENAFDVTIGQSHFSDKSCTVDIPNRVHGKLVFSHTKPWPVRLLEPGVMGWFGWLPWMECYHGVPSMDHKVRGKLSLSIPEEGADIPLTFTDAAGYIEKDRGKQFPSHWVWVQCNNFDSDRTVSLTASIAKIPYLGLSFPGHIVGFLLDDTLYRFTTYTGSTTRYFSINDTVVRWKLQDLRHTLSLTIHRPVQSTQLWGPRDGARMTPYVSESLGALVDVELRSVTEGVLFRGRGTHAGLEVMATDTDLFLIPFTSDLGAVLAALQPPVIHPLSILLCLCAILLYTYR